MYDWLTIHWLAADLMLSDRDSARFRLYRKGRLLLSSLDYLGLQTITVGERQTEARVYEHTVSGKTVRLRYFYAADNPLLPLRIEKMESGDTPAVLQLESVDWRL